MTSGCHGIGFLTTIICLESSMYPCVQHSPPLPCGLGGGFLAYRVLIFSFPEMICRSRYRCSRLWRYNVPVHTPFIRLFTMSVHHVLCNVITNWVLHLQNSQPLGVVRCEPSTANTHQVTVAAVGRTAGPMMAPLSSAGQEGQAPRLRLVQSTSYLYPNLSSVPARAGSSGL